MLAAWTVDTTQIVVAAVGAIGTILGSGAAWFAAATSLKTSREATEALATALRPALNVFMMGPPFVEIINNGPTTAALVRFFAFHDDRVVGDATFERIEGRSQAREPLRVTDPVALNEGINAWQLRFSDERELRVYEQRMDPPPPGQPSSRLVERIVPHPNAPQSR